MGDQWTESESRPRSPDEPPNLATLSAAAEQALQQRQADEAAQLLMVHALAVSTCSLLQRLPRFG